MLTGRDHTLVGGAPSIGVSGKPSILGEIALRSAADWVNRVFFGPSGPFKTRLGASKPQIRAIFEPKITFFLKNG
jgi:hypothetical protein